ncbi:ABC transporter ATP-binding protein [Candidatus Woesearchaeota archaeon]|nr:ABC transporter ATP-binding protein [Candidatus Woesearchaeota archaeon]
MPFPIIKFRNVKKGFKEHIVLKGIDLEINLGEMFGLIGSSGAGKTTFLKILIGFLEPDSGDLLFKIDSIINPEVTDSEFKSVYENMTELKKVFGFAAQTPSFYPNLTVYENLDYFGILYNLPKSIRKRNAYTLLNLIGLMSSKNALAKNLSGGMQKRLDIACALIHDPRVLILDEPTADLDPFLGKHIWNLIQTINRKGTTVVVSSHHILDLENICTRIGFLKKGKLIHVGSVQELSRKFTSTQEIHLESYPGNYDKIISEFNNHLIIRKENRGHELVIYTKKPEILLPKLLQELGTFNEILMDVKLKRISLDELFSKDPKRLNKILASAKNN